MKKHNFRELRVWKLSRLLVKEIYLITASFPQEEKFGLISQIRRCAISIPSNIAEGSGRDGQKEFIRYLKISLGSVYELETQLLLSIDLKFMSEDNLKSVFELVFEIQKMLNGLINKLNLRISLSSFVFIL